MPQFNSTSAIEGLGNTLVSSAVSGIPFVGGLASGLLNSVGGLFGGDSTPEARGGSLYDGLQKPGAPPMNADDLTLNDAQVFADAARRNNLYVQEINQLIAFNQGKSRNSWMNVVNWYRDHPDQVGFDLRDYNIENPRAPILPHAQGPIEPISTQYASVQNTSTATLPIVRGTSVATTTANNAETASSDKTTTYALIGGGTLAVIIILILILKK
jgi:hypothetical protein